ncbi:hypothetical protein CTAYLR_005651 [Chrysophaeum taylorii]|uniref:t-SNARE coiled-coil homology domain-containing protein n=1 Tax=Chrysophaeum taylorii TaxID=2483200 RepID=A0AAD7XQA3_9STRA|nr:hypothetical protein CTAYLR_005651 [Chrysophaeum taylorii]
MADRTREFFELLHKMPVVEAVDEARATTTTTTPGYVGQFHAASTGVVVGARVAMARVKHLSILVRRSSIFEDPAEEIAALIHAINDDLTASGTELNAARRRWLEPNKRSGAECARHCVAMDAQAAREVEETTEAFKHVLKLRSESVKAQTDRKEMFARSSKQEKKVRARVPVFDDGLPRPQHQTQDQMLIPDTTYLDARADAAQDIEAQVQEIGDIFGKLSSLVKQQDEQVERIETNIEQTVADVDRAQSVLLHRLNNMNATTRTVLKCVGIVTATFVFYTVVIA